MNRISFLNRGYAFKGLLAVFIYLLILSRSISDHHLTQAWGGWLNLEFSQGKIKHLGWTIKTIYKI